MGDTRRSSHSPHTHHAYANSLHLPSLPPSLPTFQISSHHFLLTKWLIVDVDVERAVDAAVTVGAEVADAAATADAEAADADVGAGVGAGVTTVTSGSR